MKNFLYNLPIRHKQVLVILLTSGLALVLACIGVLLYGAYDFRQELAANMGIRANTVGRDLAAATSSNDVKFIQGGLTALHAELNIDRSCVYNRQGRILATYQRENATVDAAFPHMHKPGREFKNNHLHTFKNIEYDGLIVGTIYVDSNLDKMPGHLRHYVEIMASVFAVAMLVALALTNHLNRLVYYPILNLAEVSRSVVREKNYALRADKIGRDEVGELVDAFNEMLVQIQAQNVALQAARDNLERRVEQRTRDLQAEMAERKQADEARRESQALYHSLVEQMPAGVFRKDQEGRFVFVNSWFCRLKGLMAKDVLGKTPCELGDWELFRQQPGPDGVNKCSTAGEDHHWMIMETGKQLEVEEKYPAEDGTVKYLHVVKSPLFGSDGEIVGSQGILFDITAHKNAEFDLQKSNALLSATLDSIADGILALNLNEEVISFNEKFVSLWELPPEILTDNKGGKVLEAILSKVKDPQAYLSGVELWRHNPKQELFSVVELKDGRTFERYVHPQMVGRECVGIVINYRDVTERKRTEEALRESQALYLSLVEQMPTAVFRKDRAGRFVLVNSSFCRLRGLNAAEMLGKTAGELATPKSEEADREGEIIDDLLIRSGKRHELILSTGKPVESEEEYSLQAGSPQHFHILQTPVFGSGGEIIGTQALMFDVTARKKAEAELAYERDLLKSMLDNFPDSIYFKDLQSRFVRVSRSKLRKAYAECLKEHRATHPDGTASSLPAHLTNMEQFRHYLLGRTDFDFEPEQVARVRHAEEQEIIRTGKALVGRVSEVKLLDGKTIWQMSTKMPWRDKDGKIIGTFGSTTDITALKEAEAKVAETSNLMNALLTNSEDYIYFKDRESRFTCYSASVAALYHQRTGGVDDLIGKTDFEISTPEEARRTFEDEQKIMDTGEPLLGQLEKQVRLDGRTTWVLTSKMPLRNANNEIIGTFGITKNITSLKQAEARLTETSNLMDMLLKNSADRIYFKDRESRFIRCSASVAEAFHLSSPEEMIGKADSDFFSPEHAGHAMDDEKRIMQTGVPVIGKMEKETWPDGRVSWALSTKMPLRDANNEIIGTFGISKDVTAIKEAETKLNEVHRELVQTSRRAGMADVATSVLHNVGNVLNSVNTSAGVITERLRKSRVSGISRVLDMFEEHRDDLAEFLNEGGRREQLVNYLKTLGQHLIAEQTSMLGEVQELAKNIEHIKEIVAMQQNYARVTGVREVQSLPVLVEDALRMHSAALDRHEVRVVREYKPVPDISVDKHKVLQILVNLISNAKYAMANTQAPDRILTLGVEPKGEKAVRITISDRGMGIPPENLTRIFSLGFTTRDNGHGFGLHSGFLAAREMSGNLQVQSDGPGRGAVFTLELPILSE